MDWIDQYNQGEVAKKADWWSHSQSLPMYKDLNCQELALLIRFPVHVWTNIIIERLMRVGHGSPRLYQKSH